jgi:hypothetical protein
MSALEDCFAAGVYANALAAPGGFCEGDGGYLKYEKIFRQKYRYWRGQSGKSYIFSVYPPHDCPAHPDAVVIIARRGGADALALIETGDFPDAELAAVRRCFQGRLEGLEFQIHVLADRGGDRRRMIEDIRNAGLDA